MRRKNTHVTEYPLLPRAIPEDKVPFVETFIKGILEKLPKDLVTLDPETQRAEVGNIIYQDLHRIEGFDDRLIIAVRDLIVTELGEVKRGE